MNSKKIFKKILNILSNVTLNASAASACAMGNEEMPESLKKLR